MATRIESTVEHAAEALAKAGVRPERQVIMTVLDPEDEAKLADLRAAIAEGDASGPGRDADEVFEEITEDLKRKFPENYST